MPGYSAIADTEIDADSPITTTLLTKMRDNPEAIATGLAGATRLVPDALDEYVAGTTKTLYNDTTAVRTAVGGTEYTHWAGANGTLDFTITAKDTSGVHAYYIYRNGVNVATLITDTGGTYTVYTVSVTGWSYGDRIQLVTSAAGSTYYSYTISCGNTGTPWALNSVGAQ